MLNRRTPAKYGRLADPEPSSRWKYRRGSKGNKLDIMDYTLLAGACWAGKVVCTFLLRTKRHLLFLRFLKQLPVKRMVIRLIRFESAIVVNPSISAYSGTIAWMENVHCSKAEVSFLNGTRLRYQQKTHNTELLCNVLYPFCHWVFRIRSSSFVYYSAAEQVKDFSSMHT